VCRRRPMNMNKLRIAIVVLAVAAAGIWSVVLF
jgi:hypothetical protein